MAKDLFLSVGMVCVAVAASAAAYYVAQDVTLIVLEWVR